MGVDSDLPHGRGPVNSAKAAHLPWEPSVRDLEIYAGLAEGKSTRQLADEFDLSHQRIQQIGQKIDAWLWPQWMERIREIKARQTESLMVIFREAMAAWRRSQDDVESRTVKNGKDGRETSRTRKGQVGSASFLTEARAALADIRKIWGADAPVEHEISDHDRVAGRPRDEVIREHIARMQAAIEPHDN